MAPRTPRADADDGEAPVLAAAEGDEIVPVEMEFDVDAGLTALDTVDRQNKVGRSGIQAGVAAALVTVTEFVLAYPAIDLDPWDQGVQAHFPPVFTAALFVLLATLTAAFMNRKPRT